MEILILQKLKWKSIYPTPGDIAHRLIIFTNICEKYDLEILCKQIDNYIDFCLYGNPNFLSIQIVF